MLVRFVVLFCVWLPANLAFGSHGPGVAFSRGPTSVGMTLRVQLEPVKLKTDPALGMSSQSVMFMGVVTFQDPGGGVQAQISVNTWDGACSVNNGFGFCSVSQSDGADCSVGFTGSTGNKCSVNGGGTCSTDATDAPLRFCSAQATGFCSVNAIPNGSCSVTDGNGKCSTDGSAGGMDAKCSVGKFDQDGSNTLRCSTVGTSENDAKCSAFGEGFGKRFCSVSAVDDIGGTPNAACTVFNGQDAAKCSVHDAGNPPDPNTTCSVLRPDGSVQGPINGLCDNEPPPGGWGGGGPGAFLWPNSSTDVYVQILPPYKRILSSTVLLLVGLTIALRRK